MDPRLLRYYEGELGHLRQMAGEFAAEYPKIAGRLGLDAADRADPYVERLLEGFAFLAARVRLKVDAEFPRFTQHLLEMVYPHYLAPTPSMAVVRIEPSPGEGSLANGVPVARGTPLRGLLGKNEQTRCEYRTAHDVVLWPLEIAEAEYLASVGAVGALGVGDLQGVRAGIRLRLRTSAGLTFAQLALSSLPLYLRGSGLLPLRLYEQLVADATAMVVRPPGRSAPWQIAVRDQPVRPLGFAQEQALLPYGLQSFDGYRLLQEYFALPSRYLFVELAGLAPAVRRCTGNELDVIILLKRADANLENQVRASEFSLFCTPAVNLFPKRAERVHLTEASQEHHVVPDRTRPMDYEVHSVSAVRAYGSGSDQGQEFQPFYALSDAAGPGEGRAYYTVYREPRLLSSRQAPRGRRTSYVGSEVFLSLVDADEAPYRHDLRQLAVETLCTNRDLPLEMAVGKGTTDFEAQSGAPIAAIRCVAGPTRPRASAAEGTTAWRLISHLSLNYLSLADSDTERGAAALRELLALYSDENSATARREIEGIRSIASRPVVRRALAPGPIAFVRGIEVTLTYADEAFDGAGGFLLGTVLEHFFAKYASINSFAETVLREVDRGEVMRWKTRQGQRHVL